MDTSFLLTESSDTQNERGEEYEEENEEENELSADPCFNDSIFFDAADISDCGQYS